MTPDGHYVLYWNAVAGVSDITTVTYEVYMDKWTQVPAGLSPAAAALGGQNDGQVLQATFAQMPDAQAPVGKGVLLDSVKGVRSYTLSEKILPGTIYAFEVRALMPDGTNDVNQRILIYSPSTGSIKFAGVNGLTLNSAGELMLSWGAPTLSNGIDPTQISYDVYMTSSTQPLATVLAGTVAISTSPSLALFDSTAALLDSATSVGQPVTMPAANLPSVTGAPIATSQTGLSYHITQPLTAGMVYLFQAQARDPGGDVGTNSRVVVYQPNQLSFAGLQESNVQLSSDDSSISLTWAPATGGVGQVSYIIYGDANFSQVIGTTTDTSYKFQNVSRGHSYTFAVRAKDNNGSDSNTKFVLVNVPALTFAGLQQSGVTVAADNSSITLTWDAATDNDGPVTYTIYNDPGFLEPIVQTASLTYTIQSPILGKVYSLGVRATDSQETDTNTHIVYVTIGDTTPPAFAGLVSATTISDTKIQLKWNPSSSTNIGQYNIYAASNLTTPLASTPSTSYVMTGLTAATTYSFVVRAVNTSGVSDQNTVQKSATTLAYSVPNFAGLVSVTPDSGTNGLTQLILSWKQAGPPTGGVVTGYQVFMSGTSGGENLAVPGGPITNVTGITSNAAIGDYLAGSATSATITGLNPGTTYYFVVRAFYLDASDNFDTELNQVEVSGTTNIIKAPTFAGATSAAQGAGLLALTTATVNWGAPQSNGVWDGFQVTYEAGTCAQGFSPSATTVTAAGPLLTYGSDNVSIQGQYLLLGDRPCRHQCRLCYGDHDARTAGLLRRGDGRRCSGDPGLHLAQCHVAAGNRVVQLLSGRVEHRRQLFADESATADLHHHDDIHDLNRSLFRRSAQSDRRDIDGPFGQHDSPRTDW
jgi:hypothetical protein